MYAFVSELKDHAPDFRMLRQYCQQLELMRTWPRWSVDWKSIKLYWLSTCRIILVGCGTVGSCLMMLRGREADVNIVVLNIERQSEGLADQSFQTIERPPDPLPHGNLVSREMRVSPRAPVKTEVIGHADNDAPQARGHVELEHGYQKELNAKGRLYILEGCRGAEDKQKACCYVIQVVKDEI